jgi:hypothetical protein
MDNPKASPITRAYLEAQKPIGGLPATDRERALFETLQDGLEKLYDPRLHERCETKIEDLQDELRKADEMHEQKREDDEAKPEPANLVAAKRLLEERRRRVPLFYRHIFGNENARWQDELHLRETTDMLENLIQEVQAWRER